jgi:flavin reductase (DIM6/NTAB) family NADH-FMN oxidoreductase RutF
MRDLVRDCYVTDGIVSWLAGYPSSGRGSSRWRPKQMTSMNPDDRFASLMTTLDPPMVLVTTADEHERAGCLVGFHSQAGLQPARLSVWLSKANHTFRVAVFADILAFHFLTIHDADLASRFGTSSGDHTDKFVNCRWQPGPGGVPLLEQCPQRVVGRKLALVDASSDHVCVILEPIDTSYEREFRPLRLSDVIDLEPGRDAEERPTPLSTREQ